MKTYFEDKGLIIPFDKVVYTYGIENTDKELFVQVVQVNNYPTDIESYFYVPIEQLEYYKQWLDNQSPDAGKMVEQSSSETPNNWKPSIEQIEQIAKFIKEPCSCCNFYDIGLDAYKDKCDGCCYDKFDMNVLRYAELISKLEGK